MFLGKDFSTRQAYSEETANEIDEEVKAIIEEAYDTARTILSEHLDQLTAVAEGLLEVETLDNRQFEELYDGVKTPEEIGQELKEEIKKREFSNRAEAEEAEKMHKKALEE